MTQTAFQEGDAQAVDLPADEVAQVTAIDVVRPDPAFAEDR